MATTIVEGAQITTMINVFTVAPERQRQVLDILMQATERNIRHFPGFISASFHTSTDGTRIINYAQWSTPDAWRAMLADPDCAAHIDEVKKISEPDFHIYEWQQSF
jgi:quinol monooxygenase YgiN